MDKKMSPKNRLPCYFCDKIFDRRKLLEVHLRILHTKERPFKCSICCKSFNHPSTCGRHEITHPEYVNNHLKTTRDKIRRPFCYFCDKKCRDLSDLARHMRIHTNEKPDLLSTTTTHGCGVCSEYFRDKEALGRHVCVGIGKSFKCGICTKLFSDEDECSRHEKNHPEYVKNKVMPGCLRKKERTHICSVCFKSFRDKSDYNGHEGIHTGEKRRSSCGICGKSFAHPSSCPRHEKIHGQKPQRKGTYFCYFCGKIALQMYRLERHLRNHTTERPIWCEICGKSFGKKWDLKRHMRIHTGEKLLNCEVCFKSFRDKWHLKRHMLIHTGEKGFSCSVCLKSFTQRDTCTRHQKTHPEYLEREGFLIPPPKPSKPTTHICPFCSKSFKTNWNLKLHLRIHTGEKPFGCRFCSKSFTTKWNLKLHMRIHTGKKRFSCGVCSTSFTSRSSCLSHEKRGHLSKKPVSVNPPKKPALSCYFCAKLCGYNSDLENHFRRSHTREKPFKCEICSKRFRDWLGCTRHKITHPEYESLVPSPSHQKLFRTYSCYFCDSVLRYKRDLEVHIRRHTGEKPFSCGICGKYSAHPDIYSLHAKLHNIKPPESCSLLKRPF